MISKCYKHFPAVCFFSLTKHAENQPQKYMKLISPFLLWLHSIFTVWIYFRLFNKPLRIFFFWKLIILVLTPTTWLFSVAIWEWIKWLDPRQHWLDLAMLLLIKLTLFPPSPPAKLIEFIMVRNYYYR